MHSHLVTIEVGVERVIPSAETDTDEDTDTETNTDIDAAVSTDTNDDVSTKKK